MSWASLLPNRSSILALPLPSLRDRDHSSNCLGCVSIDSLSSLINSEIGGGVGGKYPADAHGVN